MKVKYLGPSPSVEVGGFGPHLQGEVRDYPEDIAEELLTGRKQKFGGPDDDVMESAALIVGGPADFAALEKALKEAGKEIELLTLDLGTERDALADAGKRIEELTAALESERSALAESEKRVAALTTELAEKSGDGVIATSGDPAKMEVPELKALLDKLKVKYPAKANKPELLKLLDKNTGPPPAE